MAQAAGQGASDITFVEESPQIRQIQGVPTSIAGMVVVCERGPVGEAVLTTSWEEWRRIFGGDIANGEGASIARGFYEEGGEQLYTVRTVHYTDPATPATKTSAKAAQDIDTEATAASAATVLGSNVGPFNLESGDTLVIDRDALGTDTATFTGTAASRDSAVGPFALVDGQTLTVSVNGDPVQTVTFDAAEFSDIAAATAEEVAAVLNAELDGVSATVVAGAVRLSTDRRGTGATLNVTGGTSNTELAYTTGATAGGGNVANIDEVSVAEIKTIVELAVSGVTVTDVGGAVRITSNTTGGSSTVQVVSSSTADDELGLDNATHTGGTGVAQTTLIARGRYDGTYAEDVELVVSDATSGEASEFDLAVVDDGVTVQTFLNLTMDPDADRYVETIVNNATTGSALLELEDQGLVGSALDRRPANGTYSAMTGGDDGLSGLVDADFIGDSAGGTGFYALDLATDLSIMLNAGRATSAVQNAMISYAEVWRAGSVFVVLDPPAGRTAAEMVTYVSTTAALEGASEFAAIYWPRPKVLNPNRTVFGNEDTVVVAPSGIIGGVYARNDAAKQGGIYEPPAGPEKWGRMYSVLGFETEESKDIRKRGLVFPRRINPLTVERGARYIDGARTLKANGNFPTVAERRGVIYIEQSVKRGIQFARHRNNDDTLRREVERTIRNFLIVQMRLGAFRSKDPAKAFFLDFSKKLNPDSLVFAGQMKGRMGLATQKPAEFIVIGVTQDTRALDAELAAAGG